MSERAERTASGAGSRASRGRRAQRAGASLLGAWIAVAAASAGESRPPRQAEPHSLTLETLARALVPGELVRIRVTGPAHLAELRGEFLKEKLFFFPEGASRPQGESKQNAAWFAWAVIPLGYRAGPATIRVEGTSHDGRILSGSRRITIAPKSFPRQDLRVGTEYVEPPEAVLRRVERERRRLAEIYARRTSPAGRMSPFVRPVEGGPSGVFGARRFFNGQPRAPHPGLDLRAETGTPVRASGAGEVVLAGDLYFSGGTVIVDHGAGLFTIYAHLSRIDPKEGETVGPGQIVGLSGATGRVTGPHLHWGAKLGDTPFDPASLLEPQLFR